MKYGDINFHSWSVFAFLVLGNFKKLNPIYTVVPETKSYDTTPFGKFGCALYPNQFAVLLRGKSPFTV